jgi:hypothetical protein
VKLGIVSWNVNRPAGPARKGFSRWLPLGRRRGSRVARCRRTTRALCAAPSASFAPAERLAMRRGALRGPRPTGSGGAQPPLPTARPRRDRLAGRLAVVNVTCRRAAGACDDRALSWPSAAALRARAGARGCACWLGDFNTAPGDRLARPPEPANAASCQGAPSSALDLAGWIGRLPRSDRPRPLQLVDYSASAPGANIGWRIDCARLAAAMRFVRAFLCPTVRGSDPLPAGVRLDPAVAGRIGGTHERIASLTFTLLVAALASPETRPGDSRVDAAVGASCRPGEQAFARPGGRPTARPVLRLQLDLWLHRTARQRDLAGRAGDGA